MVTWRTDKLADVNATQSNPQRWYQAMLREIPPVIFTYIDGLKRHDVDGIAEDDLAFITSTRRLKLILVSGSLRTNGSAQFAY